MNTIVNIKELFSLKVTNGIILFHLCVVNNNVKCLIFVVCHLQSEWT